MIFVSSTPYRTRATTSYQSIQSAMDYVRSKNSRPKRVNQTDVETLCSPYSNHCNMETIAIRSKTVTREWITELNQLVRTIWDTKPQSLLGRPRYMVQLQLQGYTIRVIFRKRLYQHILHQRAIHFKEVLDRRIIRKPNRLVQLLSKTWREATFPIQSLVTKWNSDYTATWGVMQYRKQRLHSTCPKCEEVDEHLPHILTCRSQDTIEFRNNLLIQLNVWP